MALFNYKSSMGIMARRLSSMTPEKSKVKEKEALHLLFELADSDHSGRIDPSELMGILRQLGWKMNVKVARRLCEKIGAVTDEHGHLTLTEEIFLKAMIDNTIARELESMTGVLARSKSYAKKSRKKVTREDLLRSAYHGKTEASTTTLTDSKDLVKWTLRRNIVSNSLSGATQLLLLAHTPVSRKVFQFFHCNNIAGKELLIADYDIDCLSFSYYSFMPVVLVVLGIYTAALPTVILFYLFKHRKELYSTSVYQRIGWYV
tara:strand:- start:118 stop:900 length:783 start_codon:yes stop_codon:yes gene_type:complete